MNLLQRLDSYIDRKTGGDLVPSTGLAINAPSAPRHTPVVGSRAPEALRLGRLVSKGGVGDRIGYNGDQHVLVFGANGKGKGTRLLIPNLLQVEGRRSFVVVDPKGELAAVTAPYRRSIGKVVILNPYNVLTDIPGYDDLRGVGFNPFAGLDPASPSFNRDAASLADALITIDPRDPHWGNSARALVAMMIMFATVEAKERGTVPTMRRVRELICLDSGGTFTEGYYGIPAVAEKACASPIPGLRNKAAQFTSWNKEKDGIASTARIQTEPFDDTEIADNLDGNCLDFASLKDTATTVYIVLPPSELDRQSKWLRVVITAAILSNLRPRRPGECKVTFMLDEFFALGHLQIISTVWALVRGYGISIMPVLQSMIQLKELYPTLWENFLGMAGAMVSFGPNDSMSAEWLAKRAGETTRSIVTQSSSEGENKGTSTGGRTESTSEGSSKSVSTNYSDIKAPLVSAWKLYGLRPGFMTMTLDGLSAMVAAYAPPYWDIRQCWLRARDNPYFLGGS